MGQQDVALSHWLWNVHAELFSLKRGKNVHSDPIMDRHSLGTAPIVPRPSVPLPQVPLPTSMLLTCPQEFPRPLAARGQAGEMVQEAGPRCGKCPWAELPMVGARGTSSYREPTAHWCLCTPHDAVAGHMTPVALALWDTPTPAAWGATVPTVRAVLISLLPQEQAGHWLSSLGPHSHPEGAYV